MAQVDESADLARFGYKSELQRTLGFFSNFGVAFCYLSPVVGIYSLFIYGLGTGGPAYIWTIPVVVVGQLLVSLVFAELGSSYPLAGALFQWSKQLLGRGYGWWVGWFYAWALIITVASVDTGITGYLIGFVNSVFGTSISTTSANSILVCTVALIVIQTLVNVVGVRFTGLIARYGVWLEVLGTFGVVILLAAAGFHHGFGYLFTTQGVTHAKDNPIGFSFNGWFPEAALVAVLANVYIFYGFESAGDIAEEVVDARRRVPRAMVLTMVVGGITSFVLVAGLILASPGGIAAAYKDGVTGIISANIHSPVVDDLVLALICLAFFSCGTSVQAAGARVLFSYSRDDQLPASRTLRAVSPRFKTPVAALLVVGVIPILFALLTRFTPSQPVHIWFVTYPAKVNALTILVSFATSGIYLSFQMVVLAALVARLRGWRPSGFDLGAWAYPVYIVALVYGVGMLINIIYPSALTSARAGLYNFGWMTLFIIFVIAVIGAVYFLLARPHRRSSAAVGGTGAPPVGAGAGVAGD
jgi:amino acid transporter